MAWDPKLLRELEQALLAAFPGKGSLARMVRFGLGEHLETIAGGGNLAETVTELIDWAEANNKIPDLVAAARAENSGNVLLRDVEPKIKAAASGGAPPANDARPQAEAAKATGGRPEPPLAVLDPLEELKYSAEDQAWYVPGFPETVEIDRATIESLKGEIDIVLITATDVELRAVMGLLSPYPGRRRVLLAFFGPETYYLGKFGSFRAVVTKCRMGAIGEGSVTLATDQAQREWSPRAIIMAGIAFGRDPADQKLADVLVASQIISYEQQRVGEQVIYRGTIPPSNSTLLNRFENAHTWRFARPDGRTAALRVGPLLSGEKLIDDPVFKANLFQQFPQAIGGEMEGAGLCAASGRVGVPWILIKAICDWGDGKKHGKHQPLAAAAAASLVHHVLSQRTVLDSIPKPVRSR